MEAEAEEVTDDEASCGSKSDSSSLSIPRGTEASNTGLGDRIEGGFEAIVMSALHTGH